jgi:hypothetical protein
MPADQENSVSQADAWFTKLAAEMSAVAKVKYFIKIISI